MLQRTAVVGLCGVTIFVILSIIQATVPAMPAVQLSVTLKQSAQFVFKSLSRINTIKSKNIYHEKIVLIVLFNTYSRDSYIKVVLCYSLISPQG